MSSSTLTRKTVFERGDKLYIVSPVMPFDPSEHQIEEFAFSKELLKAAPNPAIKWLKGEYVEADTPNRNGQQWSEGELAIKSLTPQFMPVTVMHDRRTAVGLIADTRLLLPAQDNVQRAKIDNTLAVWAHRFPEIAEEVDENYERGTLMQSMEAHVPMYECAECGSTFHKLPDGAERENWCSHLAEQAGAARILKGVVFTGTGLIFGTRGKEGANPNAHLDVFQDEIAEFHEESHHRAGRTRKDKKRPKTRRKTSMSEIEINAEEFAELKGRPSKTELSAAIERAEKAETEIAELKPKVEAAETAQKKAEEEKEEAEKKLKTAEEEKAEVTLRDERFNKLGDGFVAKLGDTTKENLRTDAGKMEDEAWDKRLTEVEELAGVKRDVKLDPKDKGKKTPEGKKPEGKDESSSEEEEFSFEELAESAAGGGDADGDLPSAGQRQSVARGLLGGPKKEPAKTA